MMSSRATLLAIGSATTLYLSHGLCARHARAEEEQPAPAAEVDDLLLHAVRSKEQALEAPSLAAWQRALDAFELADPQGQSADIQYEIAFAAEHLSRVPRALNAYQSALALGLQPPASEHAERYLEAHRSEVGRLIIEGALVQQVLVDGKPHTSSAQGFAVAPGSHTVTWTTADGHSGGGAYTIDAGAVQRIVATSKQPSNHSPTTEPAPAKHEARARPPRSSPTDVAVGWVAPSWPLVLGGAGLTALGLSSVLFSTYRVSSERRELPQYCQVLGGPDVCVHVQPGAERQAQDTVDSIATWKNVRTGSWVTAGVGAAAMALGVVSWLSSDEGSQANAQWSESFGANLHGDGAHIIWQGAF